MSRRNRVRKPGRRDPFRDPKPLILVVCEGKRTEPEYLRGFSAAHKNPRVDVRIAPECGVPLTLVQTAKRYQSTAARLAKGSRDENLRFDSVWCVFDVDDHPNIPEAKELARSAGIKLAISNPCFELWLLLHFRGDPGPKDRLSISAILAGFIPDYDKAVDFSKYAQGYTTAVQRASRLVEAADRDNDSGRNPTTNVFQLTQAIEEHPGAVGQGEHP